MRFITILVTFIVLVFPGTIVQATDIWYIQQPITQGPLYYARYEIDGRRVAWIERDSDYSSGPNYYLKVQDLDTGTLYDLTEQFPTCRLAGGVASGQPLALDGNWVIMELICTSNGYGIYAYNIKTQEFIPIAPFGLNPPTFDFYPAADGGNVVWIQASQQQRDIYLYNLETHTRKNLTNDSQWENHPDISGEWVVWEDYALDIYAYNIRTEERVTVTLDAVSQEWPLIDGNWIVWEDMRNGDTDVDIYGFNLVTREEYPLITGAESQEVRPYPSGDILSYVYHCPSSLCSEERHELATLNLKTHERGTVYKYERYQEGEITRSNSAAKHDHGNMVWSYQEHHSYETGWTGELRFATHLSHHIQLPLIYKAK